MLARYYKPWLISLAMLFLLIISSITAAHAAFNGSVMRSYYTNSSQDSITLKSSQRSLFPSAQKKAEVLATDQEIWRYWSYLIPQEYRAIVSEFEIASDGKGNVTAYSGLSKNFQGKWVVGIDPADIITDGAFNRAELDASLIHEFGHMLFQREGQVVYPYAHQERLQKNAHKDLFAQTFAQQCPTFFSYGGCARQSSYLYSYMFDFWRPMLGDWQQQASLGGNGERFFRKNTSAFVSTYAAAHPIEDMVESWTAFVLFERPSDLSTVSAQKVNFFYQHPELVGIRAHIRERLCSRKTTAN